MPILLHEYWENEDGDGEFSPVRERNDQLRDKLVPGAHLAFGLYASSWFEACQLEYERLGYGDFIPPDDVPDHFYTAEEADEQETYLQRRALA